MPAFTPVTFSISHHALEEAFAGHLQRFRLERKPAGQRYFIAWPSATASFAEDPCLEKLDAFCYVSRRGSARPSRRGAVCREAIAHVAERNPFGCGGLRDPGQGAPARGKNAVAHRSAGTECRHGAGYHRRSGILQGPDMALYRLALSA